MNWISGTFRILEGRFARFGRFSRIDLDSRRGPVPILENIVQLLIVRSFFAESFPPGWTNRMFWWTICPSESLWFENDSFILDLYFCFLHSILHMFFFLMFVFNCFQVAQISLYFSTFNACLESNIFIYELFFFIYFIYCLFLFHSFIFFSALTLYYWLLID